MNEEITKEKKIGTYIYLAILAFITIALIVITIVACTNQNKQLTFSDLTKTNTSEWLTLNESGEYLVYIYTENDVEQDLVSPFLLKYEEYAKNNESALKLYVIEYNNASSDAITKSLSSFSGVDYLPWLVKMNKGSASLYRKTVSDINAYLLSLMSEK